MTLKNASPAQLKWMADQFRCWTADMKFTPLTMEDHEGALELPFTELVHRCGSHDLAMQYLALGAQYETWRRSHLEALFDRQRAEAQAALAQGTLSGQS